MDARHVRMMEEPVAAAVGIAQLEGNFGVLSPHQKILICDLGGGTLDMSIVTPTLTEDIRVKAAPGGDGDLGMSNLDKIMALHLMRRQGLLASADATIVETVLSRPIILGQELDDAWKAAQTLMNDPAWCGMLLQRCEALKRRICNTWTTLDEWVVVMPRGEQVVVVRDEVAPYFAAMNDAVAAATVRYLDDLRTAEAVQLSAQDITSVLVVGGGSRLPNIRETLVRKLPSATVRQINDREVTSLVQRGAACCAFRPETILERRCNSSYGVYTWSEKPPKYPDYFKRGEIKPRENGPARLYPTYERLLRRHDPLPVAPVKRVLQPIEDDLDEVQIPVLQGENEDPDQNKKVGTVILSQRKNASHRDAFVVEFFLGDDGLMHAQGRDKTGQISGRVTWSVDIS
jgi:molecular chaperone DnaK (HSP70)